MLYLITFLARYSSGGAEELSICHFEGTHKEVVEMVGNLNYHLTWDEIKNREMKTPYDGMFRFRELQTIQSEQAIRDKKDRVCKDFFR